MSVICGLCAAHCSLCVQRDWRSWCLQCVGNTVLLVLGVCTMHNSDRGIRDVRAVLNALGCGRSRFRTISSGMGEYSEHPKFVTLYAVHPNREFYEFVSLRLYCIDSVDIIVDLR